MAKIKIKKKVLASSEVKKVLDDVSEKMVASPKRAMQSVSRNKKLANPGDLENHSKFDKFKKGDK